MSVSPTMTVTGTDQAAAVLLTTAAGFLPRPVTRV